MVQSFRLKSAAKGCPFCYGKKASLENNLWDKHPDVGKLWDNERNAPTRPWEVTPGSKKIFWWRCNMKHVWQAAVNKVVSAVLARGGRCPKC